MIEEFPALSSLVTSVPVIGVMIAWLASIRTQLNECQERYERLESEYRQALRDMAGLRQQALINEQFMAGRVFQAGDDTLPVRPRSNPDNELDRP